MSNKFKLSRVAASVAVAITGVAVSQVALAGPGWVTAVEPDGVTEFRKQTFFAYSPRGDRDTDVPEGTLVNPLTGKQTTGKALRKFVDPLPLAGKANTKLMADGLTSKHIPVAVPTKWIDPRGNVTGDDYYEMAMVEFTDRFHSDLKKETVLRGYVQIDHLATNSGGVDGLPGSDKVALFYPDGVTAIMVPKTDAKGKIIPGVKVQAYAVEKPRFLGPVIANSKDVPTRIKMLNLLPVGRAVADPVVDPDTGAISWNVTKRNGDLFLPVDKSILGAGVGPDGNTEYTQNRASVHLHGGDTPWISDGTPQQWITPAGEADPANPDSLAAMFTNPDMGLDPSLLPNYLKGASTANVPDMNDPGDGAMTLYFPNGQSARVEWIHDHTFGATRLNVYAGLAAPYLITDLDEQAMVAGGALPPPERTIPMVLQDRTFVPDDIALQDARWNTGAWGKPGDSWFPHVYETVQDPGQANNWNAVGRWHYGPWFWPVFPALYALPEGTYSPAGQENTVTTTPEGWNDTPIINGVAYPTMEVDPTTYRFRLLNASNDRMMTFNLFKAKTTVRLADGTEVTSPLGDTEIDMIPAGIPLAADACPAGDLRTSEIKTAAGVGTGKFCIPETWPSDGRMGGVPVPEDAGPTIYQIANEAGWLPKVAVFEPTPINYVQDKGRIVVLNVELGRSGLFIAPAERADIVVDFSQYAGQTLLVYNDSGAPVPAGDPRNDLFTGIGDQSGSGGAEDTKPGYGPNTRTMMQIKVKAAGATPAMNPDALNNAISSVYFSKPENRPIVAQNVYSGFPGASGWANMTPAEMYGDIYLGSLKNPTFHFTPGTPNDGVASIKVDTQGGGYTVAPLVEVTGPVAGKAATAVATMKLDKITVANPGSGYTAAPLVSFAGGGGSGAVARSYLRTSPATAAWTAQGLYRVSAAGALYNGLMQLNFTPAPAGGVTTTGYATVTAGKITAINVVNPGKGYTAVPLISVVARAVTYTPPPVGAPVGTYGTIATSAVLSGTGGKANVKGVVDAIELYGLDNTTPALTLSTSGGGGYTDLRTLQITLTGGGGTGASATATGRVFDVTLTHPGSGYGSTVPSVTFKQMINGAVVAPLTPAAATAAVASDPNAKSSILVKTKTIQELFDPTYGRLNATLGVELPFTSALTQTTIPLGYVDETTEEFSDGETQIWKITHNGVDSHPVHFHLLNVQVINRVGWDGFIQPIEPREMGWKETVMMSPLEDIIVAVRAKKPTLPGFGVPLNQRLMDPTQPEGSPFGFTQIDPVTGNPKVVTNALVNYGWEYAWHCHILGHEENDFMRPIKFNANEAMPTGPVLNTVTAVGADATLNFTDTSSTEFKFSVLRAPVDINGVVGVYTEVGTDLALSKLDGNFVSSNFVDAGLPLNQYLSYKVAAVGAAGEASSNAVQVSTYVVPAAVSGLAAVASPTAQVTLSWTNDQPVTSYNIVRTGGAGPAVTFTATGAATGYLDTTSVGGQTYTYAVTAVNGDKVAASATSVAVLTPAGLAAPAMVGANVNATRIQISWLDQSATETSFVIERSTDGGAFVAIGNPASTTVAGTGGTKTFANNVGAGVNDVQAGHTYVYRVVAQNASTTSLPSATTTVAFVKPEAPSAPVAGTVTRFLVITDRIVLNWTRPPVVANAPAVTASRIEWSRTADFAVVAGGLNVNSTATTATATVARGGAATPSPTAYYFRVRSTNAAGDSLFSTVSASVATK